VSAATVVPTHGSRRQTPCPDNRRERLTRMHAATRPYGEDWERPAPLWNRTRLVSSRRPRHYRTRAATRAMSAVTKAATLTGRAQAAPTVNDGHLLRLASAAE